MSFGPVIVSQGLLMIITGKQDPANQRRLPFLVIATVLLVAFIILLKHQLAKEGYSFL